MPAIEERLRQWQQSLLDLSNRNTLLNFRPSSTRPTTIQLIAPAAIEIYETLRQGRALTILGNDPPDSEAEEDDDDDLRPEALGGPTDNGDAEHLVWTAEETYSVRHGAALALLTTERSNRVLLRLASRARSAELEQGINTLFAVFGLLKWQDPRESQQWQFAPLVMLPLRIEEVTREGRYRIAASGDDPEFNQTLIERLRRDVGIELDIDVDEEAELTTVLDAVYEAVSLRPGWEVLNQVHLGHFQFYKLRMFEDLSEHAAIAARHEIIQALASDLLTIAPLPDGLPAEEELDWVIAPDDSFTILDADASQLQAVRAGVHGSHLIIQGPPGTGKSQTIANIIAECIAAGRTVLFVSEKAAAIEVVHRRLEQHGLGEFCLMLHSHKANKREIVLELDRQLSRTAPAALSAQERQALSQLQQERMDLDAYAEALHRPRVPLEESVYWAYGQLASLQHVPLLMSVDGSTAPLTHETLELGMRLLEDLAAHAAELREGAAHPWFGAQERLLSLTEQQQLRNLLTELPRYISDLLDAGRTLTQELGLPTPCTITDLRTAQILADALPQDRSLRAAWFDRQLSEQAQKLLNDARAHARTLSELEARLAPIYEPGFFELDPDAAIASFEQGFLSRFFSSSYRSWRAQIRSLTKGGRNRTADEERAALHDVRSRRLLLARFADHQSLLAELLGLTPESAARREDAGWEVLAADITATAEIARHFNSRPIPARFIAVAADINAVQRVYGESSRLHVAMTAYTQAMTALAQYFDDEAFPPALAGDLSGLAALLVSRASRFADLDRWVRARLALRRANEAGLASIVNTLIGSNIQPAVWGATYRRFAVTSWLDGALAAEPALQQFDGNQHDRQVARFRSLDRQALKTGTRRVRQAWGERRGVVSSAFGGEPLILRRQAELRKRHTPLRRLFERIPNLLPALKPCLMMSPLSVAQYLPADRYQFDVVIFDEASQVRPYDAIGAIMRGRQLIVAGDSKQLPPTTFFDRTSDDDVVDEEQDIRALESILDALNAKRMPSKSLLWHYRSRHEDLIAYSNHHFYDSRLITFPSPSANRSKSLGVHFEFVEDGRYVDERDRVLKTPIRVNRIEARHVARLVMEHARSRPDESLLVVTLGMRQREVVEEEIRQARELEQNLGEFFREDKPEPFYVKALEQVQGDERDVILISVGYGKNAAGVLSHNFGPINQQGGERRLNVLVTRARNQVVLVSSIRYTDIDPTKTQNLGPLLLRNYLEFAEFGPQALTAPHVSGDGEYESPFEEQVGEALKRAGYIVHRQVGTSKYRIDLAIVDPRDSGRYLLGIECDGKTYHQSKTARDRDRLRQEMLEEFGLVVSSRLVDRVDPKS